MSHSHRDTDTSEMEKSSFVAYLNNGLLNANFNKGVALARLHWLRWEPSTVVCTACGYSAKYSGSVMHQNLGRHLANTSHDKVSF